MTKLKQGGRMLALALVLILALGMIPAFAAGPFPADGSYYVDLALWNEVLDQASMGGVAFKNNPRALVTVSGGKVTTVEFATNPVDVGVYHSALIDMRSDEAPDISELETGTMTTVPATFTEMRCESVDFSYDGREKVLNGFDMVIPGTGIYGITGPSGSGKSTALKMLMRFRDVTGGAVTMSGENVKKVNTASLRRNQAYVTQETQLFKDTIENNIKIADMTATREQVIEAAKKASVHDFIMTLPQGYDTNVGELGELLSSGERQRIGLARAFLSDAPLILLDEPTSNLDTLNEGRILQTLDAVRREKSIVLVSHRPSVKAVADKSYAVNVQ